MSGTTEQIQLQKLQKLIFDHVIQDADSLGEILLKYTFIGEGRGCYSNFDLNPKFRLWTQGKDQFSDNFLGEQMYYEEDEYLEETNRIQSYMDPELELGVIWYWCGDGSLIFKFGDILIENTDIKKSYGWRFL